MRTKETVNICQLDKFIQERDKKSYSLDEVLPLVEEHIIKNYDHKFPCADFRAWVNSDDEHAFYCNGIKYIWDCNG